MSKGISLNILKQSSLIFPIKLNLSKLTKFYSKFAQSYIYYIHTAHENSFDREPLFIFNTHSRSIIYRSPPFIQDPQSKSDNQTRQPFTLQPLLLHLFPISFKFLLKQAINNLHICIKFYRYRMINNDTKYNKFLGKWRITKFNQWYLFEFFFDSSSSRTLSSKFHEAIYYLLPRIIPHFVVCTDHCTDYTPLLTFLSSQFLPFFTKKRRSNSGISLHGIVNDKSQLLHANNFVLFIFFFFFGGVNSTISQNSRVLTRALAVLQPQ